MHIDHRALEWLLNLQDPSSRLTRWAVKLSEYGYVVEYRPGSRMRHADAISRNISMIEKVLTLSQEAIREEQEKYEKCIKCRQYENFRIGGDGLL